jgi:hypothetical protein
MYCGNCGKEITGKTKFCGFCGEKISQSNGPIAPDLQMPISAPLPTKSHEFIDPLPRNQAAIPQKNNSTKVEKKLNTMALTGFILGLCSLFLPFVGIFAGILACVFSGIGLSKFC